MSRLAGSNFKSDTSLQIEELLADNELLAESYTAASAALLSLQAEDIGWTPINRLGKEDGFDLESLKDIAEYAELQATGNPLLKRGFTLRRDNVFGRGVTFEGTIPPRFQKILDDPENVDMLFSESAYEKNERAAFTTGNLLMVYEISSQTFFPIPFEEVTEFAQNPNLKSTAHYYQHTYNKIDPRTNKPADTPTIEWYPVLERWEKRKKSPLSRSIADKPVNEDRVVVDFKVNTVHDHVWGVPDCLPALPYAWAHAEYIRDASKLLKALATIAWKVVAKSKGNAVNAATKSALPKSTASTATMTRDTDLVAMPRSGQVDMKDGFSILAYVASALEVSAVALSSDSGASSGSNGAEVTLDGPSANAARARQALWTDFYKRIYRAIGFTGEVTVQWPKIQEEPVYRQVQGFQIGFAYGGLHQSEYRAAVLEALDITPLEKALPEPTPFTAAAQYSVEAQAIADKKVKADAAAAAKNVQGQGVSKPNGTALGSDNSGRDMSRKPGTGE